MNSTPLHSLSTDPIDFDALTPDQDWTSLLKFSWSCRYELQVRFCSKCAVEVIEIRGMWRNIEGPAPAIYRQECNLIVRLTTAWVRKRFISKSRLIRCQDRDVFISISKAHILKSWSLLTFETENCATKSVENGSFSERSANTIKK